MKDKYLELIDTEDIRSNLMIYSPKIKNFREIRNLVEDSISDVILEKIEEKYS